MPPNRHGAERVIGGCRDRWVWPVLLQLRSAQLLRGLEVLTQGLPRGPRGADEPRAVAKPAGCDGNGPREELRKGPLNPLIQLGTHADASPEHDELQVEE